MISFPPKPPAPIDGIFWETKLGASGDVYAANPLAPAMRWDSESEEWVVLVLFPETEFESRLGLCEMPV